MNKIIKIILVILCIVFLISISYFLFFYNPVNKEMVFDNNKPFIKNIDDDKNFLDFKLNNYCGSKNQNLKIDVNVDDKMVKLICTNLLTYNYTWQDYNVYLDYLNDDSINIKNKIDYDIFDGKECNISEFGLSKYDINKNLYYCKENLLAPPNYTWIKEIENISQKDSNKCSSKEEFNKIIVDGNIFICLKNIDDQGYSWQIENIVSNQITPLDQEKICDFTNEFETIIDSNTGNIIRCIFIDGKYIWVEE
jgi:hypothetical protein